MFERRASSASPLFVLALLLADARGASAQNGAMLFQQSCAPCHGPQGKGQIGPSLEVVHDPLLVEKIVRTGKGAMPSFAQRFTQKQLEALAAFVTEKLAVTHFELTGGHLAEGGVLFRENCAACHRTAVRGGALAFTHVNAPALTGLGGDAIASAIRSGPGPMPDFPHTVFDEHQLASIVAYVRFMQHPPSPGGLSLNFVGPVAEGLVALTAVIFLAIVGRWIEARGRG